MRILPEQVSSKNNYHSHTQEPEKKDAVSVRVIAREDKERSQRESGKYFCSSSTHSFHSKFQCQLPQISCSLSDKIYLKHHYACSLQFLTAPTQTYLVHVYQLSHQAVIISDFISQLRPFIFYKFTRAMWFVAKSHRDEKLSNIYPWM